MYLSAAKYKSPYPNRLTFRQVQKLRDRAQSCVNTYTPDGAKLRVKGWELLQVCKWLLYYMEEDKVNELPRGYTCIKCGHYEKYPSYVYAHWREYLIYTCKCGKKYKLVCGHASPVKQVLKIKRRRKK